MTLDLRTFQHQFDQIVKASKQQWEAVGFLTTDDDVYAFGTDTKVLSTVFETITAPIIEAIASQYGYTIEGAKQTIYPDFTLTPNGLSQPVTSPCRIAIDIKTTYRDFNKRGILKRIKYTLGSYTSFLRDPTKKHQA